jgi:hypothetical protein
MTTDAEAMIGLAGVQVIAFAVIGIRGIPLFLGVTISTFLELLCVRCLFDRVVTSDAGDAFGRFVREARVGV